VTRGHLSSSYASASASASAGPAASPHDVAKWCRLELDLWFQQQRNSDAGTRHSLYPDHSPYIVTMSDRPRNLHPSRSFSRLDAAPKSPLSRSRASTLQGPHVDMLDPLKTSIVPEEDETVDGDVFAKKDVAEEQDSSAQPAPDVFEELPIEIRSLTER